MYIHVCVCVRVCLYMYACMYTFSWTCSASITLFPPARSVAEKERASINRSMITHTHTHIYTYIYNRNTCRLYLLLDMLRVDHNLLAGAVGGGEGEVLHQSLDDYTHTHTYIYIYI